MNPENFIARYTVSDYPNKTNFTLLANGTLLTGASFEDAKFSEATGTAFFDKNVSFIGAFGTTNWTAGRAEFSLLNIVYEK